MKQCDACHCMHTAGVLRSCQARQQSARDSAQRLFGGSRPWSKRAILAVISRISDACSCMQVAGNVELPAPAARYQWQRDDAQRLSVGQGAFRLHLDQCNVVVNL